MILSDPMLWRLVWKEYRAQRSFWLVIAGFGIGLMLVLTPMFERSARNSVPGAIALALTVVYALGCAAVLFASESEESTTEFLRIIATRTSRLFLAKVSFGFASTLALSGLLLATAWIVTWANGQRIDKSIVDFAPMTVSATVSLLLWGIFFSTVCRKVLTAVCLTALAPLIVKFVVQWFPWNHHGQEGTYWFQEILLSLPVLCTSYLILRRTMAGRMREYSSPRLVWRTAAQASVLDRLAAGRETAPGWRRLLKRLVWLEVRHAFSLGHVLWIAGFCMCSLFAAFHGNLESAIFGILILPTLFGIWVFQAEGGGRTRFLADHGLSPLAVWLSKQTVWLILTVVVVAPFILAIEIANGDQIRRSQQTVSSIFHGDVRGASAETFTIMLACLGYAAGQFASILIPRGVTAGFVGFVIFALFAPWAWLMMELQVPLWLSVAPLVIFMLAATCVWSRHWLLESATWRSWRRLGLSIGAGLFLVWGGVGAFRILEVPDLDGILRSRRVVEPNPFRQAGVPPITPAEAVTAQMYRQARSEYAWRGGRPWESDGLGKTARDGWEFAREQERQLLAENPKALETTLAATSRPACAFTDPSRPQEQWLSHRGVNDYSELVDLILLSARQLESGGKLDEALERYVAALRVGRHVASRGPQNQWQTGASIERVVADWMPLWAAHPGQSAERIEAGARRVREELIRFPSLRETLVIEQLWVRYAIDQDWSELIAVSQGNAPGWSLATVAMIDRCCPWERYRARRLLDLVYFTLISDNAAVEYAMTVPGREPSAAVQVTGNSLPGTGLFQSPPGARSHSEKMPWNWARTTFPWNIYLPRDETYVEQVRLYRELPLRALSLRLALAAWKHSHGEYPARLDDLPDAGWAVAIDPYTGHEFGYRPNGFPNSVRFINAVTYREEIVAAEQPLIWSGGPFKVRIVPIRLPQGPSPEFEGVDSNGPVDERRAKQVGAYVFTLP